MARVSTQKARKDYPDQGIVKGDTYYKWTLRPGGRYSKGVLYRSARLPRPSQLTSNAFRSPLYSLQEQVDDLTTENAHTDREGIVEEIRALGEDQREKFDNMPEGLQQGDTGQLLEGRADACGEWADELEGIDLSELEQDYRPEDHDSEEAWEELKQEKVDELQGIEYNGD